MFHSYLEIRSSPNMLWCFFHLPACLECSSVSVRKPIPPVQGQLCKQIAFPLEIFVLLWRSVSHPVLLLVFPISKLTHWCIFNLFPFPQEHYYHVLLFLILWSSSPEENPLTLWTCDFTLLLSKFPGCLLLRDADVLINEYRPHQITDGLWRRRWRCICLQVPFLPWDVCSAIYR